MSKTKVAEQRTTDEGQIIIKGKHGESVVFAPEDKSLMNVRREEFTGFTLISYAQYAMDTLIRAIPRMEDGFRLSTRRMIYEITSTPSLTKAARIVGNVIGQLHP